MFKREFMVFTIKSIERVKNQFPIFLFLQHRKWPIAREITILTSAYYNRYQIL